MTVPVARSRPSTSARALSPSSVRGTPPKCVKAAGDALAPIVLALIEKRFDEEAAGITQDRDQQKDRAPQCRRSARRFWPKSICSWSPGAVSTRTVASAATRCAASNVGHRSLDRPDADRAARARPAGAARRPHCRRPAPSYSVRASARRRPSAAAPAGRTCTPGVDRLPQIPPHRIARDADLARNRLPAHAATPPARESRSPPRLRPPVPPRRRYQYLPLELHSTLLRGVRISVARGSISLSLYIVPPSNPGDPRRCPIRKIPVSSNLR